MKNLVLMIIVMMFCSSGIAGESEKIKWDKNPIAITLPINKERMIIFPSEVRVNVPPQIRHQLRTISNDGVVYLQAGTSFDKQRVKVQVIKTGKIILLDLAASEKRTKATTIEILVPTPVTEHQQPSINDERATPLDYVQLTRFAAQSMYAPERLIEVPKTVSRSQLELGAMDTLIRGHITRAQPMVSWQSNGVYVTAVKLTNLTKNKIILDPRDIRGRWEAATFQHVTLGPQGTTEDTTSLYLISKRSYEESL